MNTQVLEYLVAVAEEGSITRAAERFYLSQPSLSHHIANLEKEMGTKLFCKEGRKLRPTREGVIFTNSARAILHVEARALQRIQALNQQNLPGLRACGIFPWGDPQKLSEEEGVIWTPMRGEDALEAVKEGSQDLALVLERKPAEEKGRHEKILWEDRLRLTLPQTGKKSSLPQALEGLCWCRCGGWESFQKEEEKLLAEAGIAPRLVCTVSDLSMALAMVEAGHGAAFLPQRWMQDRPGTLWTPEKIRDIPFRWVALLPPGENPGKESEKTRLLGRLEEWAAGKLE